MVSKQKSCFVLVHGGRHGGWAWREVASRLSALGYSTYTPTLTGLGERAHLLCADIGLETHINDLVGVFEYEDLSDVVLVAHSYGGMPVAGAMQHVFDRVRSVVWVDAHLPQEGESIFDLIGDERAAEMMRMADRDGEGWFVPTSDASWWGLTDVEQVAWVNSKTTAQPIKTYRDKIGPTDRAWSHPGTMIECNPSRLPALEGARQRARAESDLRFHHRTIDACHEPMLTHPDELTKLLVEAIDNL
ncbi:alpha/beta fold hydrolase [Arthrobacter sp. FW306-04-A]|uniref:alpha/beta fold hydrolase n=1 Tax=Arthrobacter sp. FW306-04-A TaxID=2879619 RepID=UPI0037BF17EF|nr:alpha/beta hydrolase [Arthrobacter sp. FW306-04-A]